IGTEDESVSEVMEILNQHCVTRTQKSAPTASFGQGLNHGSLPKEVKVGGATVFVLNVEEVKKL
ncbi:MAG: cyclic-di-AMP receptor, partial [Clostridia bacterium]|nr:cyclic-di-AMP receptor [Clostridia bacterium]